MNIVTLYGTAVNDPLTKQSTSGKVFTTVRLRTTDRDGNGKQRDEYHTLVFWESLSEEVVNYGIKKGDFFGVQGRLQTSVTGKGERFTDICVNTVYPPMIPHTVNK